MTRTWGWGTGTSRVSGSVLTRNLEPSRKPQEFRLVLRCLPLEHGRPGSPRAAALSSRSVVPVFVSAARSPVFSHLSSSLQGLWTIRAYKAEERFQELFDAHQDLHSGLSASGSAVRSWGTCCPGPDACGRMPSACSWPHLSPSALRL